METKLQNMHWKPLLLFFILCVNYSLLNSQPNIEDGLLEYYSFDGSFSNEVGSTTIENNGGVLLGNDIRDETNAALQFSGDAQYIELTNSSNLNLGTNFSISLWVNIPELQEGLTSSVNAIISKWILPNGDHDRKGYPFALRTFNQSDERHGQLIFSVFDGLDIGCNEVARIISDDKYNDGLYHHILIGREGNLLKMYVDCDFIGSAEVNLMCNTENSANIFLGARNETFSFYRPNYFSGYIDEFRIYNRFLSLEEIKLLCDDEPMITSVHDLGEEGEYENQDEQPEEEEEEEEEEEMPIDTLCQSIKISPNPFSDGTQFKIPEEVSFKIYNALGQLIFNGLPEEMNWRYLPAGSYFIQFEACDKSQLIIKIEE